MRRSTGQVRGNLIGGVLTQVRAHANALRVEPATRINGRVVNGATDGATTESCQPSGPMNAGSAPDWEVMIEYVTASRDVSGRPGWSQQKPQIVGSTGVLSLMVPGGFLSLRKDFDDLSCPVWLVAAPGAVGKSMFARERCAATGAVYVDLALATAVGGSYVVGALVNNSLPDRWKAGRTTLAIDAFAEARLRVP